MYDGPSRGRFSLTEQRGTDAHYDSGGPEGTVPDGEGQILKGSTYMGDWGVSSRDRK